ncbi:MAG TPA: PKD domain-containing protein [Planctomycetota bacterium]|nr:PKD domain-containing protein [Planctomycetota bacterium]
MRTSLTSRGRPSIFGRTALLLLVTMAAVSAQTILYIPDINPTIPGGTAGNAFPFGSGTAYSYMTVIPAANLDPINTLLDDIAFAPVSTVAAGNWTAANVLIAVGHLPTPIACPFQFPGPGGAPINGFQDLTVIYDSSIHAPLSWPWIPGTWSPMGLPTVLGSTTGFQWNGTNDIGVYITFSGSTKSGAFLRSTTIPPSRSYANTYQAVQSTACNAASGLVISLHMSPANGLFANFTASPSNGPAPLSVNFSDTTFTSDPGGVLTWAWDFGDGSPIDNTQNPSHVYACPGSYTVSLTVTDALHGTNTKTTPGFINAGQFPFSISTSGGGVGDLVISPVPTSCGAAAGAFDGFTLISLTTTQPAGLGPIFGIVPDPVTFQFLFSPPNVGTIPHFLVSPPAYPDGGPVVFPPGFFSVLAGISLDAVMVFRNGSFGVQRVSNVSRVTF